MVKRFLEDIIKRYLFKGKAVIIYGARQVGKATLVGKLTGDLKKKTLMMNGDDTDIRELLADASAAKLRPVIGDNEIVVIDEAQRIAEAGLVVKIIHDNFRNVQLIVTGSSSLELADKIKEPMTGRKYEFYLYPFSFSELSDHYGFLAERRMLEQRLVYGSYPDVVLNPGSEVRLLRTLASDYLYKDIFASGQVKKPALLEKILKALALQVGNEVSYFELAQLTGSDKGTVERYIDLLEKSFILFRLPGLSRNVRNEIKKGRKIYFCDNGIRNAVLNNFLPTSSRSDSGALWENYLISERLKLTVNLDEGPRSYFWRTTQQQEIDYIEERRGKFSAWEFKWSKTRGKAFSKTFTEAYQVSSQKIITPENYHMFLTEVS